MKRWACNNSVLWQNKFQMTVLKSPVKGVKMAPVLSHNVTATTASVGRVAKCQMRTSASSALAIFSHIVQIPWAATDALVFPATKETGSTAKVSKLCSVFFLLPRFLWSPSIIVIDCKTECTAATAIKWTPAYILPESCCFPHASRKENTIMQSIPR